MATRPPDKLDLDLLHVSRVMTYYEEQQVNNADPLAVESINNVGLANTVDSIKQRSVDAVDTVEKVERISNTGSMTQSTPPPSQQDDSSDSFEFQSTLSVDTGYGGNLENDVDTVLEQMKQNKEAFRANIDTSYNNWLSNTRRVAFGREPKDDENYFDSISNEQYKKNLESFKTQAGTLLSRDSSGRARTSVKQVLLEECIPCEERIKDLKKLLNLPGALLEMLEADIQAKRNEILRILNMLFVPASYIDLCELLRFLSFMCVPDLNALMAFLLSYYRGYVRLKALGKDLASFAMALISSMISPFLTGLDALLNSMIALLLAPINCILDALNLQLSKILGGATAIDSSVTVDSLLGKYSPRNTKTDINRSFQQGLNRTQKGPRGFGSNNAFYKDRTISDSVDVLATAANFSGSLIGLLFNTVLYARDWLNAKLQFVEDSLIDWIKSKIDDDSTAISFAQFTQQLATIMQIVMTMLRLANGAAFKCGPDPQEDIGPLLPEFVGDNNLGVPGSTLKEELDKISQDDSSDLTDLRDGDLLIVPKSLRNNISIDNGKIVAVQDIPGYGQITVPLQFIRKCERDFDFGNDERISRWIQGLREQRA